MKSQSLIPYAFKEIMLSWYSSFFISLKQKVLSYIDYMMKIILLHRPCALGSAETYHIPSVINDTIQD